MERALREQSDRHGVPRSAAVALSGIATLLAIGHGVNDLFASILPALLPTLQMRFGVTESTLALLVATFAFSSSFLSPFLGNVSDRFGARHVTALGIALSTVLLSLIGVVSSVALLFALLLVGGLGSAALHPAGSALARSATNGNAGLALALFSAGGMIGYAIGPVLILFIAERFGIGATAWLMIPGLLAALLVYLLTPESHVAVAAPEERRFDRRFFTGPIGLLTLAGTLNHLPFLTFVSAAPLWLVQARGVDPDASLIGFTLGLFSLASAAGGVIAGLLSLRIRSDTLVAGSMVLALGPLFSLFHVEPGSGVYFLAVTLAGALSYAAVPLMVLGAQDLAPGRMAAASGMLLGFASGLAGLLYVGVGRLQEMVGLGPAIGAAYLALIPAAILARHVLRESRASAPTAPTDAAEIACTCLAVASCGCFKPILQTGAESASATETDEACSCRAGRKR